MPCTMMSSPGLIIHAACDCPCAQFWTQLAWRRFKAFAGSAAKKNDPKSMQARRSQLRGQIEESGEEVEE